MDIPGDLLRAQDGRRSKYFRGFMPTNKQTNTTRERQRISHCSVSDFKGRVGSLERDFCTLSPRLISNTRFFHSISVAVTLYGRAEWLGINKQRVILNYFSLRFWYEFRISICRGHWSLPLCMTSVLVKRMLPCGGDFRRILRRNTFFFRKSTLRSGILFANTKVMHRGKDASTLHSDFVNPYEIRSGK